MARQGRHLISDKARQGRQGDEFPTRRQGKAKVNLKVSIIISS
jgi:hypothetical protein